ncbi:MAG TPA: cobalt ECF transporter T component CbiQ [Bacteroidota bacterium]
MRHDFLDRYSRLKSPIHSAHATLKLSAALLLVVTTVSLPFRYHGLFLILFGMLLIVAAVSMIPWRFMFGRLLILEPFALGIAAMALFQNNGLAVFLSIVVKSSLCLLSIIVLSNTTPFAEILAALRSVGVPPLLITILALVYRYLFVLIDEGERLQRARRSRTFITNRTGRWISLASLVGQLFVRSTERAERIFAAMTSRGWK